MQQVSAQQVMTVRDAGFGISLQDRGRSGWRRFGIPVSGTMDPHAAQCANRLLENDTSCAVLELLGPGAKLEMLQDAWVSLCGAASGSNIPAWRAYHAMRGDTILVRPAKAGLWSYLAVEGGFADRPSFGSVSYYARGHIGRNMESGSILERESATRFRLPQGVSGRIAGWSDQRDYAQTPVIRVYPGPQWNFFTHSDRHQFLSEEWKISPTSDRVGYRLEGAALKPDPPEIFSEPVRLGSIQVPENGQPIVTMPDGPTVGGYPKIALVEEIDLCWVAQCRPGQCVRFRLIT